MRRLTINASDRIVRPKQSLQTDRCKQFFASYLKRKRSVAWGGQVYWVILLQAGTTCISKPLVSKLFSKTLLRYSGQNEHKLNSCCMYHVNQLECEPLWPYWREWKQSWECKKLFLFSIWSEKRHELHHYLCRHQILRFAGLGGQDLLEEHCWLFCIDWLIPRVFHLVGSYNEIAK